MGMSKSRAARVEQPVWYGRLQPLLGAVRAGGQADQQAVLSGAHRDRVHDEVVHEVTCACSSRGNLRLAPLPAAGGARARVLTGPFAEMPGAAAAARLLLRREGGDRVIGQMFAVVPKAGLDTVLPPSNWCSNRAWSVWSMCSTSLPGSTRRRCPESVPTTLQVKAPVADAVATTACVPRRLIMRELGAERKPCVYMARPAPGAELSANGGDVGLQARWLIERLLEAESTDRAMRIGPATRCHRPLPVHRDLAGFDFERSCRVERKTHQHCPIRRFTDQAHNVVFIGGPGTAHPSGNGAGVLRDYASWPAECALLDSRSGQCAEQECTAGKTGRLALSPRSTDLDRHPDELGYPSSQTPAGALLFQCCLQALTNTAA